MSDAGLLLSIPTSLFLTICRFLSPLDLLNLRLTCRPIHNLMHNNGQESENLWRKLLTEHFYLVQESDLKKTLRIAPLTSPFATSTSIFCVPPADAIQQVSSAFESWKYWLKCSGRFHSGQLLKDIQDKRPLLHGPYFLRAAALWKKLFAWLDNDGAGEVGARIKHQHSRRGLFHRDWSEVRNEPGLVACQAVYAFCLGPEPFQIMTENVFEIMFDGLLGGCQAYEFYSCTHLIRPRATPSGRLIIAMDPLAMNTGARKMFCVDWSSGLLELHYTQNGVRPAITANALETKSRTTPRGHDSVLLWLEEYADRLSTGQYGIGHITPHDSQAIMLYPKLLPGASLAATNQEGGAIPAVSRAVTRGVEVVASAVYVPQMGDQSNLGFIYNIRIRLLTPADDGYVSATDRGFETCQLQSRHWRIANHETQHVDQVDGNGVVGMYPLLREGGYTDGGHDSEGTFSYTSCTRAMQGSFSGSMQFVPGSVRSPTGPSFAVELKAFALDNNPDFLY